MCNRTPTVPVQSEGYLCEYIRKHTDFNYGHTQRSQGAHRCDPHGTEHIQLNINNGFDQGELLRNVV